MRLRRYILAGLATLFADTTWTQLYFKIYIIKTIGYSI